MSTVHFKVLLRTDRVNKDQTRNVYIRLTLNRKVKLISTGISVLEKNWNSNTSKVKSSDYKYFYKNNLIESKLNNLKDIYLSLTRQNKDISLDKFDGNFSSYTDFYSFAETEIKKRSFSVETKRTYLTQISKLKQFKDSLTFKEITFDFVQAYKDYMISVLKNKPNTYYKSLSMLRTFLNWAIDCELVSTNPFSNVPIKKFLGTRNFLTINELEILEELRSTDKLNKERKSILDYFLFSCYTGLRFTDVKNLRTKDFYKEIHNNTENDFLSIDMHKTGTPVTIPIIPKVKELYSLEGKISNEKVFWVRCNQLTNRQLKEIVKIAGIEKQISYHCSRHTFATAGLEKGIPIEIISNILGHSTIKQTQIYAKVTQTNKLNQLMKFQ